MDAWRRDSPRRISRSRIGAITCHTRRNSFLVLTHGENKMHPYRTANIRFVYMAIIIVELSAIVFTAALARI
jgi:hypothetical protein